MFLDLHYILGRDYAFGSFGDKNLTFQKPRALLRYDLRPGTNHCHYVSTPRERGANYINRPIIKERDNPDYNHVNGDRRFLSPLSQIDYMHRGLATTDLDAVICNDKLQMIIEFTHLHETAGNHDFKSRQISDLAYKKGYQFRELVIAENNRLYDRINGRNEPIDELKLHHIHQMMQDPANEAHELADFDIMIYDDKVQLWPRDGAMLECELKHFIRNVYRDLMLFGRL